MFEATVLLLFDAFFAVLYFGCGFMGGRMYAREKAEDGGVGAEVTRLQDALRPFAKFACDPPCEGPCHNCIARTALGEAP